MGDGDWYFPNGTVIPRFSFESSEDFEVNVADQRLSLSRDSGATSPTGIYECRVPDSVDASNLEIGHITLTTGQYIISPCVSLE